MPLPIIADTYRVALNWTESSVHTAVNVMHILRSGSSASVIAASLDTNATAAMWGCISSTALVTSLVVTPLDGSTASYTLTTSGAKWTGGATTTDPILQVAALVKLQSTFRGRSRRGRLFLPFVGESKSGGGIIDPTTRGTMQTAWNTWLAAMIAAGSQPVIASYLHATQVPVATATVELATGTQRRRNSRYR